MNLSHKGYTKLRSKGFRAKPYRDESGNLYVGYRHKLCPDDGVAHKDIINSFKASELLLRDVEKAVATDLLSREDKKRGTTEIGSALAELVK